VTTVSPGAGGRSEDPPASPEGEADGGQAWRNGETAMRGQRTDDRWFKVLNIEQQNKEPQNDEVITSIFEIPCSTFCG
jgi:hypothetical protein